MVCVDQWLKITNQIKLEAPWSHGIFHENLSTAQKQSFCYRTDWQSGLCVSISFTGSRNFLTFRFQTGVSGSHSWLVWLLGSGVWGCNVVRGGQRCTCFCCTMQNTFFTANVGGLRHACFCRFLVVQREFRSSSACSHRVWQQLGRSARNLQFLKALRSSEAARRLCKLCCWPWK